MNHPQQHDLTVGHVAAFYHRGLLHFGFVSEIANGKITLIDTSSEAISLSPSRVILASKEFVATDPACLADFKRQALLDSEQLSPITISGESFGDICARLQVIDDIKRFALYLHLRNHPELYYQKHDSFHSRNTEESKLYLESRSRELLRKDFLQRVEIYIKSLLTNHDNSGLEASDVQNLILELRQILQGNRKEDLERLLMRYSEDGNAINLALRLRKELGDISHDPALDASGLPISFLYNAENISLILPTLPLADHPAFSIDDEDTVDYDDAISLQATACGFRLGIHVSNLALAIDADSPLFVEAMDRVSSLYLPSVKVPMLPPRFSENEFSLCSNGAKAVLSLYLNVDKDFGITDSELKQELIVIERNLSYSQVDKAIQDPEIQNLMRITARLKEQRDVNGDKERFCYTLKAGPDSVTIKRVDTQSPARMMIEELMILYNRSIAAYATRCKLPLLYRNINQFLDENKEVRNSSAFLATSPGYHPGIGAEAYLHATSPIRRVVDLINQMQVCSMLSDQEGRFNEAELLRMIPIIEKRILHIKETVTRSERYWFLKYIEQEQLNTPLQALLKGYVNGKLKAEILPWGKQVLLDTTAKPQDSYFHVVVYAVDWEKRILKADLIG